jgi:hypothetical protein
MNLASFHSAGAINCLTGADYSLPVCHESRLGETAMMLVQATNHGQIEMLLCGKDH